MNVNVKIGIYNNVKKIQREDVQNITNVIWLSVQQKRFMSAICSVVYSTVVGARRLL